MLSSAESAIDKMVYKAKEEAQELITGGQQQKTESVFQPESLFPQLNDPDDRIEVTLDDGTVARVRGL
jgi:vacuolar-type H+-ATPase subunit H